MYIDLPTSEYVTASPKEILNELSSVVNSTSVSTLFKSETVSVFRPIPVRQPETRPPLRKITFRPQIVHWPATVTEVPEQKDKSHFNTAILSLVGVVVFVWILVIGFVLTKKIQAKRQGRRAREPPSYSDAQVSYSSTLTLAFPDTGVNPSFQLHEMSESGVVDIVSSSNDAPSFVSYQMSTPNQTSTETSVREEPPSYAETQKRNSQILETNSREQPPSYEEALLQRQFTVLREKEHFP